MNQHAMGKMKRSFQGRAYVKERVARKEKKTKAAKDSAQGGDDAEADIW